MKDVYSGDDAKPAVAAGFAQTFVVEADDDPDVVSRIAQTLALANRAPDWFTMRGAGAAGTVTITARQRTVDRVQADYIRRKLAQLTSVREVDALD